MRVRRWLKLLPGLLLAALLAGTAFAGGVVITLDNDLSGVASNTPFDVDFTIRSAHDQSFQDGFSPIITAVNAETGAALTFDAVALKEAGRYRATLTLPAGTWNWTISPDSYYPAELTAQMAPLEVPAAAAVAAPAAAAAAPALNAGLLWVAVPAAAVLALALTFAFIGRRRRATVSA